MTSDLEKSYQSTLVSTWVGALLFGVYLSLFSRILRAYLRGQLGKRPFITSAMLFASVTSFNLLNFVMGLLLPVTEACRESTVSDCPFYRDIVGDILMLLQGVVFFVMILIADGYLIYRCFVVWERKIAVIVLPLFLLLATLGCICAEVVLGSRQCLILTSNPSRTTGYMNLGKEANLLDNIQMSISLATNICVTSLIALRIWRRALEIEHLLGKRSIYKYHSIIGMMIESGSMICVSLLIALVTGILSREYYLSIPSLAFPQILGIATVIITIRAMERERPQWSQQMSLRGIVATTAPPELSNPITGKTNMMEFQVKGEDSV